MHPADKELPVSTPEGPTPAPPSVSLWRHHVQGFDPSFVSCIQSNGRWFSVPMGTGIVSVLLHTLPYQFDGLQYISTIIFVLNIVLFAVIFAVSMLRYILYPRLFPLMLNHPIQSLFLGTFPIAFATLIISTVFIAVPAFGYSFVIIAWVMWWIDVIISLVICCWVSFLMYLS
jgi:tellurite resistance protein TehA-like permease